MWLPNLVKHATEYIEVSFPNQEYVSRAIETILGETTFPDSSSGEWYFTYSREKVEHVFSFSRVTQTLKFSTSGDEKVGSRMTRRQAHTLGTALAASGECAVTSFFCFPTEEFSSPLIPRASLFDTRFAELDGEAVPENRPIDFIPVGIRYEAADHPADLIIDKSGGEVLSIRFAVPVALKEYEDIDIVWQLGRRLTDLIVVRVTNSTPVGNL